MDRHACFLNHPYHHHHHQSASGQTGAQQWQPKHTCLAVAMEVHGERVSGAARRRRQRRLRQWHRHERLTVQVAGPRRAAAQPGEALRRQRTASPALRRQKAPPPGKRPGVLKDPVPQGRVGQHCGVGFGLVQALDVPVLQMVETARGSAQFSPSSLPAVAEQVIEVPILSLPACAVQRAVPLESQMAEQLVEVPTPSFFEQNADIPRFSTSAGFNCVWWSSFFW